MSLRSISSSFNCLDSRLEDLILQSPYPVEVKEIKTRRYILANPPVSSLFGMTPDEMIGLDINTLGRVNNLSTSFIERINEMDYKVICNHKTMQTRHVFFTHQKTVLVEEITKQPVVNHKNAVIGILNHTRDITPSIDLSTLFLHYENLYCYILKKPTVFAIHAFLKQLQLDSLFVSLPTRQELMLLLIMQTVVQKEHIASIMKISLQSIERLQNSLQEKICQRDLHLLSTTLNTNICAQY